MSTSNQKQRYEVNLHAEGHGAMKALKINILSLALISTATLSTGALACSTDAWNGGTGGTLTAGTPNESVSRVSGECGLKTEGDSFVEDETPVAEGRYIARFYFKPDTVGAGDHTIFQAYSDDTATTPLFSISYNGGTINFNGTATAGVAAEANKWNLIEFDYTDGGDLAYWVNKDATVDAADGSVAGGSGTVEAARLGFPGGAGGLVGFFDDFESHRSSPVGPLLICDANKSGGLEIGDVITMFNELNGALAQGQPDCNLSGSVEIGDVITYFNILNAP